MLQSLATSLGKTGLGKANIALEFYFLNKWEVRRTSGFYN